MNTASKILISKYAGFAVIFLLVACSTSLSAQSSSSGETSAALSGLPMTESSEDTTLTNESEDQPTPDMQPQLWVFGVQSSPSDAQKIGAAGVRGIIDLRKFKADKYIPMLRKYADLDLGFCMTLRWKPDAAHPSGNIKGRRGRGSDREDVPPTPEESERSIEEVIKILKSPEAKRLSGKLWVQFYNEISGGPGRFGEAEEDPMFAYATKLAIKIREEAPFVKICGPALTGVDSLDKPESVRNQKRISKLRYQRLVRTIQWSVKYGDAVDVHLHAKSGEWVDQSLLTVKRVLAEQSGGSNTQIVSWEWSPARFKDHEDKQAIHQVLDDIWNAMSKNGVSIAAYASYWPGQKQKPIYQWKSIVTSDGQPHEPFYTFFVDTAAKVNP